MNTYSDAGYSYDNTLSPPIRLTGEYLLYNGHTQDQQNSIKVNTHRI